MESNKSSVTSSELDPRSITSNEKPLSPVLSTSKINRRILFGRRLNRQKSRVKLANRFAKFSEPVSFKPNLKCDDSEDSIDVTAGDRLKKIKNLEDERQKFYGCMSNVPKSRLEPNCALESKNRSVKDDDFKFKKPISPVSSFKQSMRVSSKASETYDWKCDTDTGVVKREVKELNSYDGTQTLPLRTRNLKLSKIPVPYRAVGDAVKPHVMVQLGWSTLAGFQCASGKSIDFSDVQLDSVKMVFSEENLDDLLEVTSSNGKVIVEARSGSDLVITDSLISMADQVFSQGDGPQSTGSLSDMEELKQNCTYVSPRRMQKFFSNDNFPQTSSSTNSLMRLMKCKNSVGTSISRSSSAFSNYSASTVDSGNLEVPVEKRSDSLCFTEISDTQMILAEDNALSAIELVSEVWSDTLGRDAKKNCDEFGSEEWNDRLGEGVKQKCLEYNKDVEVGSMETEPPKLTSEEIVTANNVNFVNSQPQVDDYDDFPLNTQETNFYFTNFSQNLAEGATLPEKPENLEQHVNKEDDARKKAGEERRAPEESCGVRAEHRKTVPDCVTSKNVISLNVTPSMFDCKTLYSKNLIELHRNKNFNSEESEHGLSNIDYEISQHSVEVRQKTFKSRRKSVGAGCEGFCECERQAAEEKLIKMVKNVKKAEATLNERRKDRRGKEEKTKRDAARNFSNRNVIGEVILEEGEENVIEQEEHPNNIRGEKEKKSKRKKEKRHKYKPSEENVRSPEPHTSKKAKRESETTSERTEERARKRGDRQKGEAVEAKGERAGEEIQSTITYDHVSIYSEKSCKKYRSHKKRKNPEAKEPTEEILPRTSDDPNVIELSPNQRKLKIEIDCSNKLRINISCNSPNSDKSNAFQITAGKEAKVVESGEKKPQEGGGPAELTKALEDAQAKLNPVDAVAEEEKASGSCPGRDQNPAPNYCGLDYDRGKEKLFKKFLTRAHKMYKGVRQPENTEASKDSGATRFQNETESSKGNPNLVKENRDWDSAVMDANPNLLSAKPNLVNANPNLVNADARLQNARFEIDGFKQSLQSTGFKSASGKDIKISADALKRAEHCYEEIQVDGDDNVGERRKSRAERGHNSKRTSEFKKAEQSLKGTSESKREEDISRKTSEFVREEASMKTSGFKSAAGKEIKISADALKRAEHRYEEVGNTDGSAKDKFRNRAKNEGKNEQKRPPELESFAGEPNGALEAVVEKEAETSNRRIRVLYQNGKDQENSQLQNPNWVMPKTCGFSYASGKLIKLSEEAIKKAEKVYREIEIFESDESTGKKPKALLDDPHSNRKTKETEEERRQDDGVAFFSGDFTSAEKGGNVFMGFTTAAGRKVSVDENALNKAQKLYQEVDTVDFSMGDFEEPKTDYLVTKPDVAKMAKYEVGPSQISDQENPPPKEVAKSPRAGLSSSGSKKAFELLEDVVLTVDSALAKIKTGTKSIKRSGSGCRKRLGVSRCKQITVSKDKLEHAKLLFEDLDANRNFFVNKTPIKTSEVVHNSTPVRNDASQVREVGTVTKFFPNLELSPIKDTELSPIKDTNNFASTSRSEKQTSLVLYSKTEGNIDKWQDDLTKQIIELKKKLEILGERKIGLEIQKDSLRFGDREHRRQRPGVLFNKKQDTSKRLSLKSLQQSSCESVQLSEILLEVTTKSAEYLHFNYARSHDKENSGIEVTTDGAMVIPNLRNLVGLSEIESAFKTMAGVEPGLIPRGWIANHYRLIVWKLASYERFFPQYMKGCLCVENIVQQLKYRYDREIDRAQRSAVRKILEKDDVPQKRMVLCVSDVYKVGGNKIELELTDGWYFLKTIIDEPLSRQVLKKKVKVGTKLIIQGAEILNCDGCHPLEATDLVKLKIGYNSTRRALWHVKLGYQKCPEPFPIPLRTIHPSGGPIACLKMYVARVYPVRYLEHVDNVKVWRNGKAEEKRAREFENERLEKMERIHYDIEKEYDQESYLEGKNKSAERTRLNKSDISKIKCPRTLYNLLENSNDPDCMMESLSASQRIGILEFHQNMSLQRQQDISYRISEQVEKLKLSKRKVVSILKLLVLDAGDKSDRGYPFFVWNPTEEHMQILKEESTFCACNVLPRANGDLFSVSKTYFRPEKVLQSYHNKTKRQLFPIAMVLDPYYRPVFNEFDTVGLVVKVNVNTYDQELWLADFIGRLLYIKIKDGPKICCLLDGISRTQILSASNLIYCQPQKDFGQAIANQFTIISNYPQQRFLQEGIEMFKIQLSRDVTKLLSDCDKCIDRLSKNVDLRLYLDRSGQCSSSPRTPNNTADTLDDSSEDNTVIPTRLTTTDVAMSLIDTDQFD